MISAPGKSLDIMVLLEQLKIVHGLLQLEKHKPDPQRSRPVVYAAQDTAEILLRRLEVARGARG